MIKCPKCDSSLPDWTQTCQFCGTETKSVARPAPAKGKEHSAPFGQPKWIWPAYYLCAGYFVATGLFSVIQGSVVMNNVKSNGAGQALGSFYIVGIVVGGVTALIGIGLLAKVEFIRAIVNFFCFLQILANVLGMLSSLIAGMFFGPAALIGLIISLFNALTAALMIFLIGETD